MTRLGFVVSGWSRRFNQARKESAMSEAVTFSHSSSCQGAGVSELHDVTEPNLLRDMFPYHAVPRIVFDGNVEALDPAPEFLITDTTFRDGQQARPPYTASQ